MALPVNFSQNANRRGKWSLVLLTEVNDNEVAKELLKLAVPDLSKIFVNPNLNKLMLESFKAKCDLESVESEVLETSTITPTNWGIEFLKLLSQRHDVSAALDHLCNLGDHRLKTYQKKIHDVFNQGKGRVIENTILYPSRNKKLHDDTYLNVSPSTAYKTNQTRLTLLCCNSSNDGSEEGEFETFLSNNSKTPDILGSQSNRPRPTTTCNITVNYYTLIISAVLLILATHFLSSLFTRKTGIQSTLGTNYGSEADNESFNLPTVSFTVTAPEILITKTESNISRLAQKSSNNLTIAQHQDFSKTTSQTAHTSTTPFSTTTTFSTTKIDLFEPSTRVPDDNKDKSSLVIQHPKDLHKLCDIKMEHNVTINFMDHFEWNDIEDIGCNFALPITNLIITGDPSIRNIYYILNQTFLIRNIKIVACDKISTRNNWIPLTGSTISLNSLYSLEILSEVVESSCSQVFAFLAGTVLFSELSELNVRQMTVASDNKPEVERIIKMMSGPLSITLDGVIMRSELNIRNESLDLESFSLSLHNTSRHLDFACRTLINFLNKAMYVPDLMTSLPLLKHFECGELQSEHKLIHIRDLSIIINVKSGIETLNFGFMKHVTQMETCEINLMGWKRGHLNSSYLLLEGFLNLPKTLKNLTISTNFEARSLGPHGTCKTFDKVRNADGLTMYCVNFDLAAIEAVPDPRENKNSHSEPIKSNESVSESLRNDLGLGMSMIG